jgi:hypothetical protein
MSATLPITVGSPSTSITVKEEQEMKSSSSSNRMTQRGAIVALSYMVIAGDSQRFFFQVCIVSQESLLL